MAHGPRILTSLHSFEPGGVERVALRLVAAWASSGIDARVVLGRTDGAMRAEAPDLPYTVLNSWGVPTARFETLWMILRLPGIIRRTRPDILFCAGNSYAVVGVAMRLLLGRRCPAIVLKVSNDLERTDLAPLFRSLYHAWLILQARFIDHFVGMAEPMRAEIANAMRIAGDRVSIIDDPALSQAELAQLEAPRGEPATRPPGRRFMTAGRLVAQKNHALLIEAFSRIAAPADRLTILGAGPCRASLLALAARLGVAEQVSLPGHFARLASWYRSSDAFVLSSDYEGVPAVVIEAMAAGLPVIATDCNVSMFGLVDEGRLGRLVPVRDAEALSAAMAAVKSGRRGSRSAAAHVRKFTVERAAGAYLDAMERLSAPWSSSGFDRACDIAVRAGR